jgi:Flp pilus assembly protein TadG
MLVKLRKFVQGSEGSVMVLTALGLVAFLGFASLAIDLGHLYVVRNELQNVADAAALAGVNKLVKNQDGVAVRDKDAAYAAILDVAQRQAALSGLPAVDPGDRDDITVSYGIWNIYTGDPNTAWTDSDGNPYSNANAVRVAIKRASGSAYGPVTHFLAGILGQQTSEVAATATAYLGFVSSGGYGSVTLPLALPTTALSAAANQVRKFWLAEWLGPREAIAATSKQVTFRDLGTDVWNDRYAPKVDRVKAYLFTVNNSDPVPDTVNYNIAYTTTKISGTKKPVRPIKVSTTLYPLSEYRWASNNKTIFYNLYKAFNDPNNKINGKWRVMLPVYKPTGSASNRMNQGLWRLARFFSFGPSPAYACYEYSTTIDTTGFANVDVTNVTYNSNCYDCDPATDYNCFTRQDSCRNTNSITVDVPQDTSSVSPPGTTTGGPDDSHITPGGSSGNGAIAMIGKLVK